MSNLVLPDHLKKKPTKAKVAEEMLNAVAGVAAQIAENASAHVVQQALGPLAKLFEEFMERQGALEDALWYCPQCKAAYMLGAESAIGTCVQCSIGQPDLVQYAYVPKPKAEAPPVEQPEVAEIATGGDDEC